MKKLLTLLTAILLISSISYAEENDEKKEKDPMSEAAFKGMKLRCIGPALTSGRIIDFAVHPQDKSEFFVAVACGHVWKTTNRGINFTPVFDGQKPYSIGCVTYDPSNPHTVWVGSGENNSQRSVGYGDGIYKSTDGGKSWKNMGLKESEHIGKVIVDPRNSDVVFAAAQGPLWGPGGDRGLYKTDDGGKSWKKVLEISENTGVSDIVYDPRNPDLMFASSYQRRRHVWTLINGGPESALYKSVDGGENWEKVTNGIPGGELGRIGLAISPVNPDIVFALIEAHGNKGGLFKSCDRGASWKKVNDYKSVSAQYYQELVCDPTDENIIYSLDTYLQRSTDGGKTFHHVGNKKRHVDDHAIWIDPDNNQYLLVGGDGGIYESYNFGKTWRFFPNLPVTQFYRIAADNSEPFYYVYGGTQDNNSWGAPSRTIKQSGISNEDWFKIIWGDGYEPQIDPTNPNIVYGQWQYGNLVRFDRKSGEFILIQPQPEKGEELRWNWDTPLLISPHSPTRLYTGANKVFRSDDRGNSWKKISGDLSRNIDRNELEVMGKVWGPDAVAKNASTSLYGNIIMIDESPLKEDLLYVGTDDGLIQVTEDAGKNWRKIENIPGVPKLIYVSDVMASKHDENTVYALFNNHKSADFKPYVYKSTDKGKTWKSIASNLPEDHPVWTIEEDHEDPNLLFIGTEFGLFFTRDGGEKWIRLSGGLPSIAVRDIQIQKRENDLIVGTFGRGIYILDDYTPLRTASKELFEKKAHIFPVKDALMYIEDISRDKGNMGETFFTADNPPFGAVFTYYIKEAPKTLKDKRLEAEKEAEKAKKKIDYPSFKELQAEDEEQKPFLIFKIMDMDNNVVRLLTAPYSKGIHRIAWDLTYPDLAPVSKSTKINKKAGFPAMPGDYKVVIFENVNNVISSVSDTVTFTAKVLENTTLPAENRKELVDFQKKLAKMQQAATGAGKALNELEERVDLINKALMTSPMVRKNLLQKAREIEMKLQKLDIALNGNPSISKRNANQPPSINDRMFYLLYGMWKTTSSPTESQKMTYSIIAEELSPVLEKMRTIKNVDISSLESKMQELNSPWTPGRIPEWKAE